MKITKKLELIKKIAEELYERYDETELELFFNAVNAGIIWERDDFGNPYMDTKKTLSKLNNDKLKEIAEEVGISVTEHIQTTPPKNWEKSNNIKAFISHLSQDSKYAMKLRNELAKHKIDCFVAHEDIKPTEEWQEEIDKALQTMDFFISMHTEGFAESVWCQQEIGYALARKVKIIPIKFDGKEDPKGFIARLQALFKGQTMMAPDLAQAIIELLKADNKIKSLYEEITNISEELQKDEIPF